MNDFIRLLKHAGACREAVEWAKPYATLQEAWDACERPDWMLWLCEDTKRHEPECQRIACEFAEIARNSAVAALRSAGINKQADALAVCAPIVDMATARASRDAAWAASDAAVAAHYAALVVSDAAEIGRAHV